MSSFENAHLPKRFQFNGCCLAWNFTCPDTLAAAHDKNSTCNEAGKVASLAEDKKLRIYRHLNNDYYVVPIGIATLGSYGLIFY